MLNMADGPDDVFVDGEPEGEDLRPLALAVVLKLDPGLLGVAGHALGADLHADDAAEVVDGGVGEVADDLLCGPLAFAFGHAGVGVGEGERARGQHCAVFVARRSLSSEGSSWLRSVDLV